ncbi:MAG: Carbohydrate-selective porin, partial [Phycisphaerales bacterium]|nr:Carbohydrate-selective porin [Phycisphaerales bacterium]
MVRVTVQAGAALGLLGGLAGLPAWLLSEPAGRPGRPVAAAVRRTSADASRPHGSSRPVTAWWSAVPSEASVALTTVADERVELAYAAIPAAPADERPEKAVDGREVIPVATTRPATVPAVSLNIPRPGAVAAEEFPLDRMPSKPLDGSAEAGIDENSRFAPPPRPDVPTPVTPPPSTARNVDTGKPPAEWQRATDDWGGVRPRLEDRGVSLNATLTADGSLALAGGAHPRSGAYRQLFNATLTLDTERLVGLPGGTLFGSFQHQVGRDGSGSVVGDAQGFSNIDADGRTQVSELWYQQVAFGGAVRAKAGKIDANADFAAAAGAGEFINSSFGFSPTIPLPTYPDPSAGVLVFVEPADWAYAGVGVFDGSYARGVRTGENGPRTFLSPGAGVFTIGEAGVRWGIGPHKLAGRLAAGGWYLSGGIGGFDGTTRSGTAGYYVVAEQQVWKANPAAADDARGVGLFAQHGWADANLNAIAQHVGGGVAWTGSVDGRDDDVLGLGVTYAGFGDDPAVTRDGETAVELFYKLQVTKFFSL